MFLVILNVQCSLFNVFAQVNIQGNVYGGARQANVGGQSKVNIGAVNHDVIINAVFGGNDISGIVGEEDEGIDAIVKTTDGTKKLFIGQLFGGGNGDYTYKTVDPVTNKQVDLKDGDDYIVKDGDEIIARSETPFTSPVLGKASLDLGGGTFGYVYGGGNNATVTQLTSIKINNLSTRVKIAGETDGWALLTNARLTQMGINLEYYNTGTNKFLFSRVFGGNNKAPMDIQPTWDLQRGSIENLYSGGNEGEMTHKKGLLLMINPSGTEVEKNQLVIDNVYGGCRKADVHPNALDDSEVYLEEYAFPKGLAARVLVRGGKINNVYGGNDVKGRVYGGNAVGIYHSIDGNVYGGGNGSYPYTDNSALAGDLHYGDFYYDKGSNSLDALNDTRPNAEQVSIRVKGTDADNPTVIGGAIYCGGNSATLKTTRRNPMVELKIGSYVIADKVFLGNNGENMIKYTTETDLTKIKDEHVLNRFKQYVVDGSLANSGTADQKFNSIDLTDADNFAKYMDGCAMSLPVSVLFDGDREGDTETYVDYSSYFGSFYCGGNVGSMTMSDKNKIEFTKPMIVYSKVVGGCNNAYVKQTDYNAAYRGGIIGSEDERGTHYYTVDGSATGAIKDRLELNFAGLKIQPLRMRIDGTDDDATAPPSVISNLPLVWNTIKLGERDANGDPVPVAWNNNWKDDNLLQSTMNRRFHEGNIYGGCCESGIVNGNVIININSTVVDRSGDHGVFDDVETDDATGEDKLYGNNYSITNSVSGVILGQQGMDVLGSALNIFGGGKGKETEIWGSTTINLIKGYVFQVFGGSEQGAIGKRYNETKDAYGRYRYDYDSRYSTYVNLSGSSSHPGKPKSQDMSEDLAEAEFFYGGGFEGAIAGDTHVTLNNGRIFNTFGGSCNADVQGHTETYVGIDGFPYIRDHIYGGNDLGGEIKGLANFKDKVRTSDILGKVHGYSASNDDKSDVLNASAYIEYRQGRVEKIFGGCYGVYDYADPLFGAYFFARGGTGTIASGNGANIGTARPGYSKPKMDNTFINFRPTAVNNSLNTVGQIYGAGQGKLGLGEQNLLQNRSYILVDVPQTMQTYLATEIFGAGECGGVGMGVAQATANAAATAHKASAIIDLFSGQFKAVYGGSYKEGITRRTVVNVPDGSTIKLEKIFGGAYGVNNETVCDVYESNVNWNSDLALVGGYRTGIYGGNNAYRRTLYSKVNINAPVYYDNVNKYYATAYGAGYGKDTWAQYTEVNLNGNGNPAKNGARLYEVYGGSQLGKVMNKNSVTAWAGSTIGLALDNGYIDNGLTDDLATYKYNTNVRINKGASVCGYIYNGTLSGAYAYGGGLGSASIETSGDVYGTTYIGLFGGTVVKDIYAAGTIGSVNNRYKVKDETDDTKDFVATTNAYIEGGTCRNVYGGGWQGTVGYHEGVSRTDAEGKAYIDYLDAPYYDEDTGELLDIPGETNVVIGILKENLPETDGTADYHFYHGIPTIERNAYGGGEGGAVWGTTHITVNNGYVGYTYDATKIDNTQTANIDERYVEKIEDDTYTDDKGHFQTNKRLDDAGCVFGGGYVDNSSVDFTNVTMYGGHVRNALFGGGEIAAIGRGKIREITTAEGKKERELVGIYRPGKTLIEMFDGYVHRNVFGGGRGYNNVGEGGTLFSDGYVFGQTLVHIHGGEIGTDDELLKGHGNVFGGGDIGYVYSAYEYDDGAGHMLPRKGVKSGTRYDGIGTYQGYFYEHAWADDPQNTPDTNKAFIRYRNGSEDSTVSSDVEGTERKLTEDCKVLIEPHCKVTVDDADDTDEDPATPLTFNIKYEKDQVVSDYDLIYIRSHATGLLSKIDTYGRVTDASGISFTRSFVKGEYVPTSALHTLGNKDDATWAKLEANTDDDGIIIHNAVFAGGNTSKNADDMNAYANTTSVYGNATASIHDVYHRDLITIGTGHIGGLYGDGNLTFVDGYRGLNVTNYGTDYYYFFEEKNKKELSYTEYNEDLLEREKEYYELRYKCVKDCQDDDKTNYYKQSVEHPNASTLTADDIFTLFASQEGMFETVDGKKVPNSEYWEQNGVCSIYAGRILNTIQRADFCGVFGSRMVMQGAQDRVPEVVDYTKYTINRVREVSLNKKASVIDADKLESQASTNPNRSRKQHGNYFGIYSVVNYLGALTSDVNFTDKRITESDNTDNFADFDPSQVEITVKAGAGATTTNALDEMQDDGKITYSSSTVTINNALTTNEQVKVYRELKTLKDLEFAETDDKRLTNQTYYDWKEVRHTERNRNNGSCHNKVALASGVYLELTTEESTGKDLYEKVWGLITGVVELDLINVQNGMGGGFVYAKNVHGVRTPRTIAHTTLTALNAGARTQWDFKYEEPSTTSNDPDENQMEWQTSGNFIHSTQTIIDDCYNVSNKYKGPERVPAHYWYIKGSVYVYDQYISAYTGTTNAYSETVDMPLTITAASHGMMKLLDVQPNKFAYYSNSNKDVLTADQKLVINNVTYNLNTPISYWEWYKLSKAEQALFVDNTYVTTDSCQINGEFLPPGRVMLPGKTDGSESGTYWYYKKKADANKQIVDPEADPNDPKSKVPAVIKATVDENDNPVVVKDENDNPVYEAFTAVFHESNNMSHDTGYILTYTVNNPKKWDTWYTHIINGTMIDKEAYETVDKNSYEDGPTYHLKNYSSSDEGTFLGQRKYKVSDLIANDVYSTYQTATLAHTPTTVQATFVRAYFAKTDFDIQRTVDDKTTTYHLQKDAPLSENEARNAGYVTGTAPGEIVVDETHVAAAFICTKTIPLSATENIYVHSLMSASDKQGYIDGVTADINNIITISPDVLDDVNTISDLASSYTDGLTPLQKKELSELILRRASMRKNIVEAYYCTSEGNYGGNWYAGGRNYRGMEAWSSMSEDDREEFEFNYDAFDLVIDPTYSQSEGEKYQYDSKAATKPADFATPGYSVEQHVDYTATYHGTASLMYNHEGTMVDASEEAHKVLTREEYESLANEQRHYAPLTVSPLDVEGGKTYTFYVVRSPLLVGPNPYAAGSTITKEEYDILLQKAEGDSSKVAVDVITKTTSGTWYYCREAYTPPSGSHESVTGLVGSQIESGVYENLTNLQKNFTIHGIAPTETSTLYVSRNSDINDLSTEKIITVIYEYNYEESDVSGMHITPITERHVMNIHINFKTGAPTVADIEAPPIILPGEYLGLTPPDVIDGASPTQGGGWELYKSERDADNHNGIPYTPGTDPLYWYQHGYWLRYYALSHIGGKTYSNKVQVSVANYHDLKKVMDDKAHHYYVDIPDMSRLRASKIYINDGTDGLNQLKDLFKLSLLETEPTTGTLAGHALLDEQVKGCANLEFIMRTNVNHTGTWESIGGEGQPCFEGTLHGDGYYIKGLDHSLFDKLCGDVYNLGVMGSFTGAGIAETGDGYVENCWVKTTATPTTPTEAEIAAGTYHYAVFGNPTRQQYAAVAAGTLLKEGESYYTSDTGGGPVTLTEDVLAGENQYYRKVYNSIIQVVNSYYPESNAYYDTYPDGYNHGKPIQKPDKAFYNGEVAYDLNGFYLFKRYADGSNQTSGLENKFYTAADADATTKTTMTPPSSAHYGTADPTLSSAGVSGIYAMNGYVEDRYYDGDFRYANGSIPDKADVRTYMDTNDHNKLKFYPIWPDDYLFFGQMLTYDWNEQRPHEEVPSHLEKSSGRLTGSDETNRVYRAPAYYRNATMSVAHFNPNVNLVAQSKPKNAADTNLKDAYPGMTAIDFAGHNDLAQGYQLGLYNTRFYPPLLDDDGLLSIVNRDETPNLVVYAPAASGDGYTNEKTEKVLSDYFVEPKFTDYEETGNSNYTDGIDYYNRVYAKTENGVMPENEVHGHLVKSNLITANDHLLVDKKDFNCPISYTMGSGYRMWYQRIPDTYVEPVWSGNTRTTKGWESVSLPFTAELVTTVKKGEITHFYNGSEVSKNGTNTKLGHEYWLRKYRNINPSESNGLTAESTSEEKAVALFTYPGITGDTEEKMNKEYTNSFLWDYYYNNANAKTGTDYDNHHLDKNKDEYQTYYKPETTGGVVKTYDNYALLTRAIPYIIGFPGKTFYEFDLSGQFEATTTADDNPEKLPEQAITFASKASDPSDNEKKVEIGVSDLEKDGVTYAITKNSVTTNYTFKPSYLNEKFAAGTANTYTLSSDGSSYDLVPTSGKATEVSAFRPYFTSAVSGSGSARQVTRSIIFSNDDSQLHGVEEKGDPNDENLGNLSIYAKKHKIIVESALNRDIDVRIVNTAGITVASFTLEPGEIVETRIYNAGVYIVQSADNRYIKKLAVK